MGVIFLQDDKQAFLSTRIISQKRVSIICTIPQMGLRNSSDVHGFCWSRSPSAHSENGYSARSWRKQPAIGTLVAQSGGWVHSEFCTIFTDGSCVDRLIRGGFALR
jgi:hypothetical protein